MKKITGLLLIVASLLVSINYVRKAGYSVGEAPIVSSGGSYYGDFLASNYAQTTGQGRFAIELIESAIAKDPENKDLLNHSFGIFIYNGDFEKAIEIANKQVEEDKKNLEAKKIKVADINPTPYLVASVAAFKAKEYKRATEILAPVLDATYEPVSHIDGVILPMIAAWSNVASKDFKAAFTVIDNITSNYMLSVFSYHRALINDIANKKPVEINGKKYEAEELANALIPDIFAEIGRYSIAEKSFEEAVIYFRFADYLSGNDDNKAMLAAAFEAQGKYQNAIDVLSKVEPSSLIYLDSQIAIAIDEFRLKNSEKAESILNKVADDKSRNYKALLVLAGLKMEAKAYPEAVDILNKALKNLQKEGPETADAYFNLGICYDKLGKWDEAERNMQKALKLQPKNAEFLNYLAYSWIIRGKNIEQSKKMLEQAIINSGAAGHILDSYGWALYKLGDYKKAVAFLEQASNQMAYNPVVNEHLGDTYWKLGRKKEAEFQWKKAIENYKEEYEEIDFQELKRKAEQGLN